MSVLDIETGGLVLALLAYSFLFAYFYPSDWEPEALCPVRKVRVYRREMLAGWRRG